MLMLLMLVSLYYFILHQKDYFLHHQRVDLYLVVNLKANLKTNLKVNLKVDNDYYHYY